MGKGKFKGKPAAAGIGPCIKKLEIKEYSAASNSTTIGSTPQSNGLKRRSTDIGWEYGELANANNYDKVKCKLCGKMFSGGIYRLKQHVGGISGNATSCPNATPLDKNRCKEALNEAKRRKQGKKEKIEEARKGIVLVDKAPNNVFEVDGLGCKVSNAVVPVDQLAITIVPESSVESNRKLRQQNINDVVLENRSNELHASVARWVYESGVPFSVINNDAFRHFVEAVGQFGPVYMPPSQYQLREPLLKQEVERTRESLRKQEQEWKKSGCSILVDAWSNKKKRILNLCVNGKGGTCFSSFVEDSHEPYTEEYIVQCIDKHIEEIGSQIVIQVVTDNVGDNMAAAKMMKEKRPNIFWSLCATRTLNIILEGIGNLPQFKPVIDKAKTLTKFIYAHHKTLALMRKFTKKRDIVRLGVTKFVTSFLTMKSILENGEKIRFMFCSTEWDRCKLSTTAKASKLYTIIIFQTFWTDLATCVEVFKPLVRVLRLVHGDVKPSMSFVYGKLQDAKKEIINICKDVETTYKPIIESIDSDAKDRLDTPLHLAGYLLNPYYYYRNDEVERNPKCMDAIMTCIEAFFPDDLDKQHIVSNVELLKYKRMEGLFSKKLAIMGRSKNDDTFDPVGWWFNYGCETPHLRMMAMKILSLTSTSSGCEKLWSTFEEINTKERNMLDAETLTNLVYVQFNAKLANKKKTNGKCDVLLANDAGMAQEWIMEGDEEEGGNDIVDSSNTYDYLELEEEM